MTVDKDDLRNLGPSYVSEVLNQRNTINHDALIAVGDKWLMHHGVEGQKWGVQNGPPYPLEGAGKRKFLKQVGEYKKRKRREKILKDPKKIVKYSNEFTTDELKEALEKIKVVDDIKTRLPKEKAKRVKLSKKKKIWAKSPATLMKNIDKFTPEEFEVANDRLKKRSALIDLALEMANKPAKAMNVANNYLDNVKKSYSTIMSITDMYHKKFGGGLTSEDSYKMYLKQNPDTAWLVDKLSKNDIFNILDEYKKQNSSNTP